MGSLASPPIRRVAIVGSGPGGVAAAKYLRAEHYFDTIDIFEQQDSFGGVWNYSPVEQDLNASVSQTNPNTLLDKPVWREADLAPRSNRDRTKFLTPMYEGLETNIPHVLMKYSDAPSLQGYQLFPTRESVLEYLEEYAEDTRDLVQFRTQVVDIKLKRDTVQDIWIVVTKRLGSDKISTHKYDAIVVANGHYDVPFLPDIKGIRQWNNTNPGVIAHSKLYRNPTRYVDKKVIVVGNSASGVDIANQISTVAKHPVLNSTRSESPLSFGATWKKNVPEIAEFLSPSSGNRAVRYKDDRIETHVDAILFCTGYYYSFPFLSSLRPKLIDTGERVQHLYRHLFYIDHPSLAFIGLPSKIIPFRTFEGQAAVIARVWANRLALPSADHMKQWEKHELAECGSERAFHVLSFPRDFSYHNEMVEWAKMAATSEFGKTPPKWSGKETWQRERFPLIKKAFGERGENRHSVMTVEDLGFDYDQAPEEERHKQGAC